MVLIYAATLKMGGTARLCSNLYLAGRRDDVLIHRALHALPRGTRKHITHHTPLIDQENMSLTSEGSERL